MKKLNVTYQMSRPGETAESCITLPVSDEAAEEILGLEVDSYYYLQHDLSARLCVLIHGLANLQGYKHYEICTVEEVTP